MGRCLSLLCWAVVTTVNLSSAQLSRTLTHGHQRAHTHSHRRPERLFLALSPRCKLLRARQRSLLVKYAKSSMSDHLNCVAPP